MKTLTHEEIGDRITALFAQISEETGITHHIGGLVFALNPDASMGDSSAIATFGKDPEGLMQCAVIIRDIAAAELLPTFSETLQ